VKAEEILNAWHKTQTDLPQTPKKIFLAGFGAVAGSLPVFDGQSVDGIKMVVTGHHG
jgi:hypothetical protein